jgi:hypothetical protein
MQIREAQKHPDSQHCLFKLNYVCLRIPTYSLSALFGFKEVCRGQWGRFVAC